MNFPIIQQHDDLIQAVDAKELYQKLGLHPANWSAWSKNNIVNNPFALEGTDYGVYKPELNTQGGRPTTNYALSIEFAKKLSMQVQTKKGEEVRDYFLECERKASQPKFNLPQTFSEALLLAGELQKKIETDAPKVAHYDAVVERGTLLNATQVAQSLGLKSAQELNKRLALVNVYNNNCKRGKAFQAWFLEQGLGNMKQGSSGHMQPLFTTKGQAWVFDLLGSGGQK